MEFVCFGDEIVNVWVCEFESGLLVEFEVVCLMDYVMDFNVFGWIYIGWELWMWGW